MAKTQLYAVKTDDGFLVPWTVRDYSEGPKAAFERAYPDLPWSYRVVKVRLVEEPTEGETPCD